MYVRLVIIHDNYPSPSPSTILERRAVDGEGFMQAPLLDSISRVRLTTPWPFAHYVPPDHGPKCTFSHVHDMIGSPLLRPIALLSFHWNVFIT